MSVAVLCAGLAEEQSQGRCAGTAGTGDGRTPDVTAGSGGSLSPAQLPSRWLRAPSKLAQDSTQAAESFPYLTTLETLYIDKLQRLSA